MMTTPTAIVMARLISPYDFGIAASTGFFLSLARRLTNFGFNQALVRVKHLRPEHSSSVFVITLAMGFTAYAILVASAGAIAAFFNAPQVAQVIPIAALTFIISPFGTVPAALLVRDMQFQRTAAADWIGGLGEAVSAIWLAWAGFGFWSLVYSRVIGDTLNSGAKVVLGRWRPSLRFSLSATRELFSFGSGVFFKRLLDYAASNLDNLVVGRVLGITMLGFYDKAFMSMNKVLVRINSGGPGVSFRVFALNHEERERFQRAYQRVVLAASLLSYPLLVGLAAAGPELIPVVYGDRWLPAVAPFQLLCLAGALKVLNEYAGTALQAAGHIWGQVTRQAIHVVLIIAFVAMFGRSGITGAALGVLLATVLMAIMMNALLVRVTRISASAVISAQVPGLIAALVVAAAVLGSRGAISEIQAVRWQLLVAEAVAGTVAYVLFLKLNRFPAVRRLLRDSASDLPGPLGLAVRLVA
jgi:PST family polysaccharide transporter